MLLLYKEFTPLLISELFSFHCDNLLPWRRQIGYEVFLTKSRWGYSDAHASLAEFERDLIVERTQAGLAAARARVKWSTKTGHSVRVFPVSV
ncbi:recombinase family protein, partial [Enterobacter bugandensis]